ncbi:MAG: hypothetical protein A3J38_02005 [Gammaproteobacteria bacterium RIFCSPHIGHO2_12_FULL_45_9]|nr:MAG: hypothetical protein A3J38_02005 [Gammaproteobacteria bacterium RIFCSPHIGHO2_12_FULL_45_9]
MTPPDYVPAVSPDAVRLQHTYIRALEAQGLSVVALGETIRIVMPTDLLFAPTSSNLTEHGRSLIAQVADFMRTYDIESLDVAGYTDTTFDTLGQYSLSRTQAETVLKRLVAGGLPAQLGVATGYGSAKPVSQNNTAKGRAANRRVEIAFRFYPHVASYE